jgi:hypothetical protein
MNWKMDRQGSRTPAQLEQRYALGKIEKCFAEVQYFASETRRMAVMQSVFSVVEGTSATYQMVVDNWIDLPNNGTWSCIVQGSETPQQGCAFGYRVEGNGSFIYFDNGSTAKFVVMQDGSVAIARDI